MAKILHVDSSSRSADSLTRQLSKYFVEQWTKSHPADTVVYKDLVKDAPGPLTADSISAMFVPAEQRTESMSKDYANLFEKSVEEVTDADMYVFGVPMYNFGVPGVFKSYIDRIVLKDHTFAYGANGFKGLLENKKAFVIRSSGASYEQPPFASMDFHEPYLRAIFGFIGITDITFIKVDGHSEEEIATSVKKAKEQIELLAVEQKLVSSGR
jgi:FMN-dependent NADH-azoreductase